MPFLPTLRSTGRVFASDFSLPRSFPFKSSLMLFFLGLEKTLYGRAVLSRLNLIVLVEDLAFLGKEEGPAFGRHAPIQGDFLSFHSPFDTPSFASGYAERFCHLAVRISQEGEVKSLGFLEQSEAFGLIPAYSDHFDIHSVPYRLVVAEGAGLLGAATSHGGGIEVDQDELFSAKGLGYPFFPFVVDRLEIGDAIAHLEGMELEGERKRQTGAKKMENFVHREPILMPPGVGNKDNLILTRGLFHHPPR